MTRAANARFAGAVFLLYFAAGIASLIVVGRATRGVGIEGRLANIAQHTADMRLVVLFALFNALSALVLGVTLYALTREQDRDLAMLALTCRVIEAVNNAASMQGTLGLLWLATATGANAPDAHATHTLALLLFRGSPSLNPMFFAVGSTLFCWLFLRGRMIPAGLAWLGLLSSVLLVVILPLQFVGLLGGPMTWSASITWFVWLPLGVFEIALALLLLTNRVAAPRSAPAPGG